MSSSSWWRNHEGILTTFYPLFLGQVVSFVRALLSFASSLVANLGVNTPLSLSFFTYIALALVYGGIMIYRRQKLQIPWYWYALIGFADVQGSFLGTRYSPWQFFGTAVCLGGLGLVLVSDAKASDGSGGSKPILGDIFVIIATFFFSMSNVGEEFCVKKKDHVEVVSMIGLFGLLVTIIEIPIFERKSVKSVKWSAELIVAFCGYAAASFIFYTLVPFLLKMSGSTLFNLSLLTSDVWAVVIRTFFYKQKVEWLFFVAFGLVVTGLLIYSKTEKDHVNASATIEEANNAADQRYQLVNEDGERHEGSCIIKITFRFTRINLIEY
ncbi:solute carrier family 35 member F2-like isoform X3 [Solanum pennellii]|uniref:Solute carrier family 35 member F2-like isoform X3 n=1 Tax=Solanum pennellii TaxID=28526 RepID=A0ABM1UVW2_SOLPN|nr:solute carrier family 35 member F2-like isoform X3 [Solanum pennellii]